MYRRPITGIKRTTENSSVFRHRLKIGSNVDDVTETGRLFQARAAATGDARSPMVTCLLIGTTRVAVEADQRLRAADDRLRRQHVAAHMPCRTAPGPVDSGIQALTAGT